MVSNSRIQVDVAPGSQDRIDQYHAELADIRLGTLCQLLLQAFEPSNHKIPVVLPDLLKDATRLFTNCHDFLKFFASHGVPHGFGDALSEAVYPISDDSSACEDLIVEIKSDVGFFTGSRCHA